MVAHAATDRLGYAIHTLPDASLLLYEVAFKLAHPDPRSVRGSPHVSTSAKQPAAAECSDRMCSPINGARHQRLNKAKSGLGPGGQRSPRPSVSPHSRNDAHRLVTDPPCHADVRMRWLAADWRLLQDHFIAAGRARQAPSCLSDGAVRQAEVGAGRPRASASEGRV